jgi:tetratricopeptide (TPR) repeat protein
VEQPAQEATTIDVAEVVSLWSVVRQLVAFLLIANAAIAQDSVSLSVADDGRPKAKLSGKVLDYTGKELLIELAGGVQKKYPGEQVVDIETRWTKEQTTADAMYARRQYNEALTQYLAAGRAEERRWVRRKILSQMIRCYRELNQPVAAGDLFLALLKEDPATPYFDTIPLAWLPGEPPPGMEQKARQWLFRDDQPAAVLLGASHLLSTADRPAALDQLNRLAASAEPRIALLAQAQIWRATFVTATPQQVSTWLERMDRIPEPLRAGPYLTVGRALAHHQRFEDAATVLLRVPILYSHERTLAAEALWSAGNALEKFGQKDEAQRLYQELSTNYPESRRALEMKGRIGN